MFGRRRQRLIVQALPYQGADGVRDRCFLRAGDMVIALQAAALFQGRAEIGGDAGEAPGAKGFDARLLHGFENCAGVPTARLDAAVCLGVVIAQAKGERIRRAAHHLHIKCVEVARREGKLCLLAAQLRRFGVERDRKFLATLSGDGAHGAAHGALKALDRIFFLDGQGTPFR